jgi:crotonobetainyl-CoA:carnitine CoA-transferase CaiB-like acyl-CoA transferase
METKSKPLSDVKICDLMWVMAGPASTRILADYGATIVRVESPTRIDAARTVGPFQDNRNENPDATALWNNNNAGKLDIALDLAQPAAREVVLDLVRWAGILTESFSPKALRAWQLDYENLRKVRPDLIMLSSCLMGQSGPLAMFAGFGNMAASIAGFYNLCGWPDRKPAGPFGAYTDYVAPRFTVAALLAAIDHRRRTGEGQYIDQSQAESALHFLSPAILDCSANDRVWGRVGNHDPNYAPHGVYPAAGEDRYKDRWIAIACRTDDHWRALCAALGHPEVADDSRFNTFARRDQNRDALDLQIAEWTRGRDRFEIERALQECGVPAGVVQDSADCAADPQLAARGHFVELPHPVLGKTVIEGPRFHLSRTPAAVERAAPTTGQDRDHVLRNILGYSDDRISELARAGAFGQDATAQA